MVCRVLPGALGSLEHERVIHFLGWPLDSVCEPTEDVLRVLGIDSPNVLDQDSGRSKRLTGATGELDQRGQKGKVVTLEHLV